MNVPLNAKDTAFIRKLVADGIFKSEATAIHEAIGLLRADERKIADKGATLKQKLDRAVAEAENGELIPGETVFAELEARLERYRQAEEANHHAASSSDASRSK